MNRLRQVGFDREGRPLMYACFAQCQTLKNNPDDVVGYMVYLIEHAKRSIQTSVNTLVFIIDCTEPLKLFIEQQRHQRQQQHQRQQPQQQSNQNAFKLTYDNLSLKTHMPHTNIMDCLNKTLKQVKIQSFYNGKYIKPNKEELQAYGVDINDNLSEINGGSEVE
ncbi:unnamed protein product [Schistosoma margrebowiei]|uniref:Uncharacterized protein n=1 Tax=Schistosoma margrebowiei TaxID=48269 RepID=A0A183N7F8_9TREM|nr:unnamed protein product [Schistosoma margrebowiei]